MNAELGSRSPGASGMKEVEAFGFLCQPLPGPAPGAAGNQD